MVPLYVIKNNRVHGDEVAVIFFVKSCKQD